MKKPLLLWILLSLFNFTCRSQPTVGAAKLDSFFNALSKHNLAMGSIAVSVNGVVQYQKAIGSAFVDGNAKMTATVNTKYRIGSVSKLFTAVMIFQLIEEGKLQLSQTIDKYFTGLPNAHQITISHLLNHRSGLHNYTEGTDFPRWMNQPKTHEELLKLIADKGTDYEPGAKSEYSNTNYLLLSYIVEKTDGISYAEALRKRIITKINLTNTYYGRPIDSSKNEACSYKYADYKWTKEKETDMSIHSGAGSIVSTPADLIKFIEALCSYKLAGETSLDKMRTFVDGYGMGLFPFSFAGKMGYGHNGKIEGFATSLQYFPEEKLAIAYCTNGQVYAKDDILRDVLGICYKQQNPVPLFEAVALQDEELDKYLGKYVAYQMPITLTCTKRNNRLWAETQGQHFEFEAIGKNHFRNVRYGYFFEFFPEKNELVLKDTDNTFYLKKEN